MIFSDVIEVGHVEYVLGDRHEVEFAPIPFEDCHGQTGYWISRDGLHVYVGTQFGGWWKLKKVKIYPAGFRAKLSAPSFKRRNSKGSQCQCTVPRAVYGAFVTKDALPKFNFKFRDGDINNCSLDNLAISEDSSLLKNMNRFKNLYEKEYYRVFAIVSSKNPEIDRQRILDYVSDGFLRVCGSTGHIRDPVALWVHCATENLWQNLAREKTVYVAFYPNDTITSDNEICGLPDIGFLPQYLYDTAMLVYEGLTQKEAADILGVSQSCIASRVKKIRQLIAEVEKE